MGKQAKATKTTDLPKIGNPATNALAALGVTKLGQLSRFTEKEFLAVHGIGAKALRILKPLMQEHGVEFAK